ncbi:MAG: multicomponent Na+:H+ antiporter subunit [Eubacteriaceae bacterium]|jgi:multicomponent Na+:H+ antiporter subunit B|nr:multicomponent Na+:H+ antiporter subunit [Eubacteriaceae bacterium]MDK2904544.1 multicomponent Na+:H+ antiporter subunit [Eubacteriaceae bacterium]MDK2935676.1 multicomponent Na+:H+ antiporter subunit [Eubacteriaceae bacterium]MDK2962366.1 multicomponent Na+:H+ antiporter subunit [Eubacteriaceae bacterium]MDN5306828.1 multicomponent Na+:H+ antiporter subunit [Eubacteriaceae bacterium]
MMNNSRSEIISTMTGLFYPYILLLGFYVILNGHISPGGGFQGGAVLASVFISRYLVDPEKCVRIKILQTAEKLLFLAIILFAVLIGISKVMIFNSLTPVVYLIIMNSLIGIKVCCGLTIIFFRYVFYEGGI